MRLPLQDAFSKPSTKAVVQALGRWGVGPREYSLLIVNELGDNLALSARNVERLEVNAADALRVYDVLRADKILIEASALRYIQVSRQWHTRPVVIQPRHCLTSEPRKVVPVRQTTARGYSACVSPRRHLWTALHQVTIGRLWRCHIVGLSSCDPPCRSFMGTQRRLMTSQRRRQRFQRRQTPRQSPPTMLA